MDIKKFYQTARKLKDTKRSGWAERGVKYSESVSDHSYMVAILCMIFPKEGIDKDKAVKMALVHDLAESETGDIMDRKHFTDEPAADWKERILTKSEKDKMERKVMEKIVSNLPKEAYKEVFGLWKEYEERKTKEALFVKDIDVVERVFQALDYHSKKNYKKDLKIFWDNKNKDLDVIKNKDIRKFLDNVISEGW
jgi:putative hydrolase of HD superfamily